MTFTLNPQRTLKAHSRGLLTNRTLKPSEPSLEGEGVEGECECNQILYIYTQTNFNRGRHNAERNSTADQNTMEGLRILFAKWWHSAPTVSPIRQLFESLIPWVLLGLSSLVGSRAGAFV